MPILEITQAADVGMGSFYNHFESKEQLYEAAYEAVLDAYGQQLDHVTAGIEDPAEVFASSFRLDRGDTDCVRVPADGTVAAAATGASNPLEAREHRGTGQGRPRKHLTTVQWH